MPACYSRSLLFDSGSGRKVVILKYVLKSEGLMYRDPEGVLPFEPKPLTLTDMDRLEIS